MTPPTPVPQRILAIKLADLGDVLNITPALRALRQTFPQAQLDVLLNPHTAILLEDSPLVDEIIRFPKTNFEGLSAVRPSAWLPLARYMRQLRSRDYDTVINFHHLTTAMGRAKQRTLISATGARTTVGLDNGHGGWLTHPAPDQGFGAKPEVAYWLALAAELGAQPDKTDLQLSLHEQDYIEAEALLNEVGFLHRPFAVLHPGSGGFSLARRWDPPKFAALAATLLDHFALPSLLVGTPSDGTHDVLQANALSPATVPIADLSGRTTIKQLAAILSRATLFVGADSGVMHLAAAMRTPIVAIFGPTNHLAWAPWTPESPSEIVRLDLPCSPCAYVGHSLGQRHGCAERTCLADLGVQQVLSAVEQVLKQADGRDQDNVVG